MLYTRFNDFVNSRMNESEVEPEPEIEHEEPTQSSKEAYMEIFKAKKHIRKDIQEYLEAVTCYTVVDLSVEESYVKLELDKKSDCKEKESSSVVMERICKMLSCSSWKSKPSEDDGEYIYTFKF